VKRESLAYLVSGTFFGVLVGWIIGSQQVGAPVAAPPAAPAAAAAPANQAPVVDVQRAAELERRAKAEPRNAAVRVDLGDLYYDASRFDLAVPWYEAALTLDPKNVNVSTDLAVCYYNLNEVDRALAQIERSLAMDARHLPSLLNQGLIRAFGKQDLKGAAESWERVVQLAPDSVEGRRAKQGLDGLRAAHPDTPPGARGRSQGGGE
jgi:tetratricopeptide (TPR) repeat protein